MVVAGWCRYWLWVGGRRSCWWLIHGGRPNSGRRWSWWWLVDSSSWWFICDKMWLNGVFRCWVRGVRVWYLLKYHKVIFGSSFGRKRFYDDTLWETALINQGPLELVLWGWLYVDNITFNTRDKLGVQNSLQKNTYNFMDVSSSLDTQSSRTLIVQQLLLWCWHTFTQTLAAL